MSRTRKSASDPRAVVLTRLATLLFVLVMAFTVYGMVFRDAEILASVWRLVEWGSGLVALWLLGEKLTRALVKIQE